jgi:pilus assembly protein Flp/PilA
MTTAPRRRRRIVPKDHQAGQGLVEYALILVLIALVAIAALAFFGTSVSGYLSSIGTSI